jgi:hypothetical protein
LSDVILRYLWVNISISMRLVLHEVDADLPHFGWNLQLTMVYFPWGLLSGGDELISFGSPAGSAALRAANARATSAVTRRTAVDDYSRSRRTPLAVGTKAVDWLIST